MENRLIYFDHAATTPVDPRVLSKMIPYFSEDFGNPSSIYQFAQRARHAIDLAREETAKILSCHPKEIIFTGSGTESNNLAILGVAEAYAKSGKHIVVSAIEHDSILKPLEYLETKGYTVTRLSVRANGIIDVDELKKALTPETILVTIMYANNEIGTIQPIHEIAEAISSFRKNHGKPIPLLHTDACQAAAYLPLSTNNLGVDLMTLNGGKIYGPKGVGALFIKKGVNLVPMIFGGGQEYRIRSGTENVPGIVGFTEALKLVQEERERETKHLLPLRDRLINGMLASINDSRLNGDREKRLPNNVNISFRGLEGETILLRLDMLGIAASSGSACTSGSLEPSHVIRALGLPEEWTHASTRFSLGKGNTQEEVEFLLKELPKIIQELRTISPFGS